MPGEERRPTTAHEDAAESEPVDSHPPGLGWLWGMGAAGLGVIAYAAVVSKPPPTRSGPKRVPGVMARSGAASPARAPSGPPLAGGPSAESSSPSLHASGPDASAAPPARLGSPDAPASVRPPPEPPAAAAVAAPTRSPRDPPPGTPPAVAALFKRIPVSPADRAPVGGIGATGVHIDDIAMGTGYARSRCTGTASSFSIEKDGVANVCVRVVHQRLKEELVVAWQKVGGHARRGKVVIKPAHAYRTRAYLKLRGEYVGDWVVKILSSDGVELARQRFSVVP